MINSFIRQQSTIVIWPQTQTPMLQEQESLLAAYDEANRSASARVKSLELALKEQAAGFAEERRALERNVVRAAEEAQSDGADTAAKLRCARTMRDGSAITAFTCDHCDACVVPAKVGCCMFAAS